MDLIVVSPENEYPKEHDWVCRLFDAGLWRYHLRKPGWDDADVEAYLEKIPHNWRSQVVVHQCHEAIEKYDLGGWHFKDREQQLKLALQAQNGAHSSSPAIARNSSRANEDRVLVRVSSRCAGEAGSTPCKVAHPAKPAPVPIFRSTAENLCNSRARTMSRSIHKLEDLDVDLTLWDYVLLSPVYRSITKANYGPRWKRSQLENAIRHCKESHSTKLYALGGVEPANVVDCFLMGFDGVALLGAVWSWRNPVQRYLETKEAIGLPSPG